MEEVSLVASSEASVVSDPTPALLVGKQAQLSLLLLALWLVPVDGLTPAPGFATGGVS